MSTALELSGCTAQARTAPIAIRMRLTKSPMCVLPDVGGCVAGARRACALQEQRFNGVGWLRLRAAASRRRRARSSARRRRDPVRRAAAGVALTGGIGKGAELREVVGR